MSSPKVIVSLDDEAIFHRLISRMIDRQWSAIYMNAPDQFEQRMLREIELQSRLHTALSKVISSWQQGENLIPQVLKYWAEHPERHDMASICLVDYSMPGRSGLDVLKSIAAWKGVRVLMTAYADEKIAVQAFNKGLIDQFFPKGRLTEDGRSLNGLLKKVSSIREGNGPAWNSQFKPEQLSVLHSMAEEFLQLTSDRWDEYVVLGEPFGILGREKGGAISWLQLEFVDNLAEPVELAESVCAPRDVINDIGAGKLVAGIELADQLQLMGTDLPTAQAFPIGRNGVLIGGLFTIPEHALAL